MRPITLVLHDNADYHAVKRALTTEREKLAALERSALGPDAKASKASLDRVDAILARLDALVIYNLAEHFAVLPPTTPHAAWRPKPLKAKHGIIRVLGVTVLVARR